MLNIKLRVSSIDYPTTLTLWKRRRNSGKQ